MVARTDVRNVTYLAAINDPYGQLEGVDWIRNLGTVDEVREKIARCFLANSRDFAERQADEILRAIGIEP